MKCDWFHKVSGVLVIFLLLLNIALMAPFSARATESAPQVRRVQAVDVTRKVTYKFVRLPLNFFGKFTDSSIEKVVEENSAQGWELVQVVEGPALVILKK